MTGETTGKFGSVDSERDDELTDSTLEKEGTSQDEDSGQLLEEE